MYVNGLSCGKFSYFELLGSRISIGIGIRCPRLKLGVVIIRFILAVCNELVPRYGQSGYLVGTGLYSDASLAVDVEDTLIIRKVCCAFDKPVAIGGVVDLIFIKVDSVGTRKSIFKKEKV